MGCNKAVAQSLEVKKSIKKSIAKSNLISWSKSVGTAQGYKMNHGKSTLSNLPRDSVVACNNTISRQISVVATSKAFHRKGKI